MAYTPNEWACGETITAEKLNHMEDGIESANSGGTEPLILQVVQDGDDVRLDKTFGEIKSAFNGGKPIYMIASQGGASPAHTDYVPLYSFSIFADGGGDIAFLIQSSERTFTTNADEDYPTFR